MQINGTAPPEETSTGPEPHMEGFPVEVTGVFRASVQSGNVDSLVQQMGEIVTRMENIERKEGERQREDQANSEAEVRQSLSEKQEFGQLLADGLKEWKLQDECLPRFSSMENTDESGIRGSRVCECQQPCESTPREKYGEVAETPMKLVTSILKDETEILKKKMEDVERFLESEGNRLRTERCQRRSVAKYQQAREEAWREIENNLLEIRRGKGNKTYLKETSKRIYKDYKEAKRHQEIQGMENGRQVIMACIERLRLAAQEVQDAYNGLEKGTDNSSSEEEAGDDAYSEDELHECQAQTLQTGRAMERMTQESTRPGTAEEITEVRGYLEGETDNGRRIFHIGQKAAEGATAECPLLSMKTLKKVQGRMKEAGQVLQQKYDWRDSVSSRRKVMMPLVTRSLGVEQYQPWGHSDVQGLMTFLPSIRRGAGLWISKFESRTEGQCLALGDIKHVLSQLVGREELKRILDKEGLADIVGNPVIDKKPFNDYRTRIWKALRAAFPNRFDQGSMTARKLKDDEDPTQWIDEETANWEAVAEADVNSCCVLKTSFRNAILRALPLTVQTKTKSEWKLNSMSHEEFKEFIRHHMELYREDKEKKETLDSDLQRKLLHRQLEDHKGPKKAVQAPVVAQTPEHTGTVQASSSPIPTTAPVATQAQAGTAVMTPTAQLAPAILNVPSVQQPMAYLPWLQPQWSLQQQFGSPRGGGQFRGRGRSRGGSRQLACYICNNTSHLIKDCPHNTFNQNNGKPEAEGQGQQPSQGGPQGPVSPAASWGGQFN